MKSIVYFLFLFVALQARAQSEHPSFRVELSGKGKPVILIPGYTCSGEVWKETVAHLQARYECHVVTLAGYAGVAPVDTPLLKTAKNELIQYAEGLKGGRPVLIGHSLGAFLSLWMASEKPALFDRVVCVDGLPFLSALNNPAITADSLIGKPQYDPALVSKQFLSIPDSGYVEQMTRAMLFQVSDTVRARQIAGWSYRGDRLTQALSLLEIATTDLRSAIAKITAPVLVLGSNYGSEEKSYTLLEQQYKQLPQKKIVVAVNSKHFIMYDQPTWMYAQIDQFL